MTCPTLAPILMRHYLSQHICNVITPPSRSFSCVSDGARRRPPTTGMPPFPSLSPLSLACVRGAATTNGGWRQRAAERARQQSRRVVWGLCPPLLSALHSPTVHRVVVGSSSAASATASFFRLLAPHPAPGVVGLAAMLGDCGQCAGPRVVVLLRPFVAKTVM